MILVVLASFVVKELPRSSLKHSDQHVRMAFPSPPPFFRLFGELDPETKVNHLSDEQSKQFSVTYQTPPKPGQSVVKKLSVRMQNDGPFSYIQ